jgi:nucleoid-associated protein YgaU
VPVPEPEVVTEALPPAAVPEPPAPQPAPAAEPAPPPPAAPDADYVVRSGDTLSEIASGLDRRGRT